MATAGVRPAFPCCWPLQLLHHPPTVSTPSIFHPAPSCLPGPPGVGFRVTPEFCFSHWSTQVGLLGGGVLGGGLPLPGQYASGVACAMSLPLCRRHAQQQPAPPFPACFLPGCLSSPVPLLTQCRSAFGGPVDPHLVLGGFPTSGTAFRNFSADATAFVVTFPIDSHPENRCVCWVVLVLCRIS